jgi:hypothetical protein
LNFSFYENSIGLISVGGYLKNIDNLIYSYNFYVTDTSRSAELAYYPPGLINSSTLTPKTNLQIFTYVNDPNWATNYGLEFSWQTFLWYLPKPFDGLVININYTHVFSKEAYPYTYLNNTGTKRKPVYANVDTSYTTSLLDQPNDMGNLSIGYDYLGFSIRASLIYQNEIFSGVNFWPQLRQNTSAYRRWDLSAKQDLPWYGMQVYADVNNLTGENDLQVIQAPTGVPVAEQDYGLTADLGIRIKL